MAGVICAMACSNLLAQETEFDLSSQRLEIQQVLPVPGKKIDHQGIIINPTPHKLTVDRNNMLDIAGGLVLKDKQEKFAEDLKFLTLTKKGVKLTIDFGKKVALKQGVKEISGAYTMRIDKKELQSLDMMNEELFMASKHCANLQKALSLQKNNYLIWISTIIQTYPTVV